MTTTTPTTYRCSVCGCTAQEQDTALVRGRAAGNYKRAGHQTMRRVCRGCTQWNVSDAHQKGYRLPTGQVNWQQAADLLNITPEEG